MEGRPDHDLLVVLDGKPRRRMGVGDVPEQPDREFLPSDKDQPHPDRLERVVTSRSSAPTSDPTRSATREHEGDLLDLAPNRGGPAPRISGQTSSSTARSSGPIAAPVRITPTRSLIAYRRMDSRASRSIRSSRGASTTFHRERHARVPALHPVVDLPGQVRRVRGPCRWRGRVSRESGPGSARTRAGGQRRHPTLRTPATSTPDRADSGRSAPSAGSRRRSPFLSSPSPAERKSSSRRVSSPPGRSPRAGSGSGRVASGAAGPRW